MNIIDQLRNQKAPVLERTEIIDAFEERARVEAFDRYSHDVCLTLGGVRHGFIEGAMWALRQLKEKK